MGGRSVQAIVRKASSTDTDDGLKDEKGNAPERMWHCCSSLSG